MNEIYVTYCSARKNERYDMIPAIERYQSIRIRRVYELSRGRMLILSGRFGLLRPNTAIPYYDHLLQQEEVNELAERVAMQLRELGVQRVIFVEHQLRALQYREAMARACRMAGVEMVVMEL